jgi:hypothetical protein
LSNQLFENSAPAAASYTLDSNWQTALRWGCLGAFSWFAIQSFLSAFRRSSETEDGERQEGRAACILRVVRVVWCNPLTYVELLLIPDQQRLSRNRERQFHKKRYASRRCVLMAPNFSGPPVHINQAIRVFDKLCQER